MRSVTPSAPTATADTPPLPHLSGSPEIPWPVRQARLAVAVGLSGLAAFFALAIVNFIYRENTAKIISGGLFFCSFGFSFAGFLLGLKTWNIDFGKAALMIGGATFVTDALILFNSPAYLFDL